MARLVTILALASVSTASLIPRQIMHGMLSRTVHVQARDTSNSSNACSMLSEAYAASDASQDDAVFASVAPSVAMACLRSVPVDKARDLELIEYLIPFVSFHSTIEILKDPPEEYLVPGVDVLGGMAAIEQKLQDEGYESQYEVMLDLQSIFVAASDSHFNYPPALLNLFGFSRQQLDLISISTDGLKIPEIYMRIDVTPENPDGLDYEPSPIDSIDGTNVTEFLERDAIFNIASPQDPDAQFNNLFTSIPGIASGRSGTIIISSFEIPDNYTIKFRNGTSITIENQVIFLPGVNFTGVDSGEMVHELFEVPPTATSTASGEPTTTATNSPEPPVVLGYPYPIVKEDTGVVAGYFLNGTGYEDIVVLAILSFMPLGVSEQSTSDEELNKFILDGRNVVKMLAEDAKKDGRTKLIIDLSANGGGAVELAHEIYHVLFPQGEFALFDRMRANSALGGCSARRLRCGKPIKTGEEWFGPYVVEGQNVTAAFVEDVTNPVDGDGYDPKDPPDIKDAPFTPENILIVTDGTCASSCNILTGLLARTQGIKTLALGGRPLYLPMQAMGNTKGTQASSFLDLASSFAGFNETVAKKEKALELFEATAYEVPTAEDAPLLPFIEDTSAASVNARSGYTLDQLEGYPVQFRYEAANCRLFYTAEMAANVTETWRRAAEIAWKNGTCVSGSTVNEDGTIGDETLQYNENVRSRVPAMSGPGSIHAQNGSKSSPNDASNSADSQSEDGSGKSGASRQHRVLSLTLTIALFVPMITIL